MAKARKKTDTDATFRKQLNRMQKVAEEASTKRIKGDQQKWMMPEKEGWDGDLTDWEGMKKPFSRDKLNEALIKALDPSSPGVVGDNIVALTQIDILSVMERAFRMRHTMSFPRCIAHMAARQGKGEGGERGHGGSKGVFKILQAYISGVLKQAGS